MSRAVLVGVAVTLLATAQHGRSQPHRTQPATRSARKPLFSRHSIDTCTPSPPGIFAPWPRCRPPMAMNVRGATQGGRRHRDRWQAEFLLGRSRPRRRPRASRAVLVANGPGARPIAVVWAPYEFWQDGKTSHCGVDVFDLVRIDGEWRVSNSMWTVEPDACTELRPADNSKLRPED